MAKRGTQPPYTTAADIASFFERIGNKAPPSNLDAEWVENYGIAANQPSGIIAMVKWLGIVNEDGSAKPDIWNKIRQSGSRAEALEPLVRDAYAAVFDRLSVEDATREDLDGVFIDAYAVGDADKKVKCFLTLCEFAGIQAAAAARQKPSAALAKEANASPTERKHARRDSVTNATPRLGQAGETAINPAPLTIALNVEIPSDWTEEQVRERIAAVRRATDPVDS